MSVRRTSSSDRVRAWGLLPVWVALLVTFAVGGMASAADPPAAATGSDAPSTGKAEETAEAPPTGSPSIPAGRTGPPEPAQPEAAPGHGDAATPVEAEAGGGAPQASEVWSTRIDRLAQRLGDGEATSDEADALYERLSRALRDKRTEVGAALRGDAPDALERRVELHDLYAARLRLLELVSPGLHSKLMGAGPRGRSELRLELGVARLDVLFQTLAIPHGLRAIAEAFFEDPLGFFGRFAELIFALVLFRLWRRWASTGLPEAREAVLAVRPQTEVHLQLARLLWYADRFRGPLEWLALLYFVSTVLQPGDLGEVATLVGVILLWTLMTRFGFLVVDAFAAGAEARSEDRVPELRVRSLRLVAGWVLLAGLGLDLISRYVGEAALHAWAARTVALLTVPIALLLIVWWRDEINRRVRRAAGYSALARRIRGHEKDMAGYPNTVIGAGYLVGAEAVKLAIGLASHFEGGRKMVATLLRREVERDVAQAEGAGEPISNEIELALLTPDTSVIAGPYTQGLERLKAYIETGRGGTIAVLAERGGGIGTFLDLLQAQVGDAMRIIDCPLGGFEKLQPVLAAEFGLSEDADLEVELRPRLEAEGVRVLAFHDLHRIVRPVLGGLAGLDRIARIVGSLGEDVLGIFTLTHDSWYYISRMLGDRAILHQVIRLPAWSEEQLERLVDARCKKAGIDPDYRRLSFPRQYDDRERKTHEERNRFGYRRVLWELSDGNPEVAIRLFTNSLRSLPGDHIIVRLPQPASSSEIAAANLATMLTLKVLMETEFATLEDLQESIRERPEVLRSVLAACLQNGWIEQVYDHYQITWSAYRRVKAVLIRRGLIAR